MVVFMDAGPAWRGKETSLSLLMVLALLALIGAAWPSAAEASASACGPTWTIAPTAAVSDSGLSHITAAPGGALWAVGNFSIAGVDQALIEEKSGSGWVSVAANAPASSDLSAISAASANNIWAVGSYNVPGKAVPLIEHWDGSAWAQVTTPSLTKSGHLYGVFALGSNNVWAVGALIGGNEEATLIEHWDGSSWSVVPSPSGPGTSQLDAVAGDSASSAWAVGSQNGKTLAEYWDGVDWRIVTTPSLGSQSNILYSVADVSASDVWAVGVSGGSYSTLAEHWNGSQWKSVAMPKVAKPNSVLFGVAARGPRDVWAVGYAGTRSLAEYWNGKSWSTTTSPSTASVAQSVTILPGGAAWSVNSGPPLSGSSQICPAEVTGSGFVPASVVGRNWQAATWLASVFSKSDQTVLDGTGLGLFDSGPLIAGTLFSYTFFASGTYSVVDPSPLAVETVEVPLNIFPLGGTESTKFSLHWAAKTAPFGYVYDVQVKLPTATQFTSFATSFSTDGASFTPTKGPGTYQFRARLRKIANGYSSAWSPPRSITINR